jgi:L-arabinose isomerase
MGEANAAMARTDRRIPLVARPQPITRTRGRQLALVTSLEPGPATLFALTLGPEGRWRLISSRMRIMDTGPLAGLPAPHFKIAPDGDVREWLTAYAKSGGPHHNAVCFGDATGRIRAAAQILDAEHATL